MGSEDAGLSLATQHWLLSWRVCRADGCTRTVHSGLPAVSSLLHQADPAGAQHGAEHHCSGLGAGVHAWISVRHAVMARCIQTETKSLSAALRRNYSATSPHRPPTSEFVVTGSPASSARRSHVARTTPVRLTAEPKTCQPVSDSPKIGMASTAPKIGTR